MKIDLAGPRRHGLAMGLNEAAGYLAVALTAYLTGLIAAGPGCGPSRSTSAWPMPASAWACRRCWSARCTPTSKPSWPMPIDPRVNTTPNQPPAASRPDQLSTPPGRGRHELAGAGPVLQPGRAGQQPQRRPGLGLPLLFVRGGLSVGQVGLLAALYPAVWGLGQLITGPCPTGWAASPSSPAACCSGHRAGGTAVAGSFVSWATCAILLGAGTAMVYPTLLAAISDVAHPGWRATAVGVYRLWRDTGLPWARWPAWWPTSPAWRPRCGSLPPSRPPPACRCRAHVRDPPTGAGAAAAAAVRDLPGPQHAARLPVPPTGSATGWACGSSWSWAAPSTSSSMARPIWG